jgi:hypothetical protein
MANEFAKLEPPPSPCTPRKTLSCIMDCETPDTIEPARTITMPASRKYLRP